MEIGMMWRVNKTTESLSNNVKEAADYYAKKYGNNPDMCLVHPSMLNVRQIETAGITVRPYRPILPNCLWIGIEDKS